MAERYLMRLAGEERDVEVDEGPEGLRLKLGGRWHQARMEQVGQTSLYALVVDNHPTELFAVERADGFDIVIGWERYPVAVGKRGQRPPPAAPSGERAQERAAAGGWVLLSPMTGVVFELCVRPGDAVAEGDLLMVIEAMKMNNELRAQRAGTVSELYVQQGERVEQGTSLLLLA